jgi:hypothetical protein
MGRRGHDLVPADLPDEIVEGVPLLRVQTGGRFVQDQYVRVGDLVDQTCLDAVRQAEREDRRPSATRTAGDLPDQQRAPAVEGEQEGQGDQQLQRYVAEEVFANPWSQDQQSQCRRDPLHGLERTGVAPC